MATNDTTPLMLITNVGLAAASRALPEGPYIHIVKFEIGSAFGYTPDVNQTQLQGNILFGGDPNPANWARPSDYRSIGDNTLDIILEIPPEAGPWEFGEVGIFAEDENHDPYLFAIAVFQSPQTKFSSLGTNVVSSYQLNCLLKLQQSTAIFQIDTQNASPYVFDIFQWSDVFPPSLSANPDIPTYNVKEPNSRGDGTFLITTNDNLRTYVKGAYDEIFAFASANAPFIVVNSSTSFIEVTQAQLNSRRLPGANRSMLVQTHAGFWRSVSSVVVSGANYRLNLNVTNDGTYSNSPLPVVPQIGEVVHIYSDAFLGDRITYEQIVDPPPPPALATAGAPGLATAGSGTYIQSAGFIAAAGMLHAPSQGTGRVLTSADNLSAEGAAGLPSGVYSVIGEASGVPNGYPFPASSQNNGTIYHTNVPNAMTQLLIPYSTANKVMYRTTQTGNTNWSPWSNLGGTNSVGLAAILPLGNGTNTISPPNNTQRWAWQTNLQDGGGGGELSIFWNGTGGGNKVASNSRNGGGGYGRWNNESGMCAAGDSLTIVMSDWSQGNIVIYNF
jgi:hypothetical protein